MNSSCLTRHMFWKEISYNKYNFWEENLLEEVLALLFVLIPVTFLFPPSRWDRCSLNHSSVIKDHASTTWQMDWRGGRPVSPMTIHACQKAEHSGRLEWAVHQQSLTCRWSIFSSWSKSTLWVWGDTNLNPSSTTTDESWVLGPAFWLLSATFLTSSTNQRNDRCFKGVQHSERHVAQHQWVVVIITVLLLFLYWQYCTKGTDLVGNFFKALTIKIRIETPGIFPKFFPSRKQNATKVPVLT